MTRPDQTPTIQATFLTEDNDKFAIPARPNDDGDEETLSLLPPTQQTLVKEYQTNHPGMSASKAFDALRQEAVKEDARDRGANHRTPD